VSDPSRPQDGVRDYSTAELKHNVVALAKAAKAQKPIVVTTTARERHVGVRRSRNWSKRCLELRSSTAHRSMLSTTRGWLTPSTRPGRKKLIFAGISL
jgi:hypothetical protein